MDINSPSNLYSQLLPQHSFPKMDASEFDQLVTALLSADTHDELLPEHPKVKNGLVLQ
jgi:hypothetical protein